MFKKILLPIIVVVLVLLGVKEISSAMSLYGGTSYSTYSTYYYYPQGLSENPPGCLSREKISDERRKLGNFCLTDVQEASYPEEIMGIRLVSFIFNQTVIGFHRWIWAILALVGFFLVTIFLVLIAKWWLAIDT